MRSTHLSHRPLCNACVTELAVMTGKKEKNVLYILLQRVYVYMCIYRSTCART